MADDAPTVVPAALVGAALIVATAWAVGAVMRSAGQPSVIGQILAGVVLGPTVLGAVWATGPEALIPFEVRPALRFAGDAALALFMFAVGLRIYSGRQTPAGVIARIAAASVVVPFALGVALAVPLHERHSEGSAPFAAFALFLGVATSITAVPVLAQIVREHRLDRTRAGATALACAAFADVAGWVLLAVAMTMVGRSAGAVPVWALPALTVAFALVVIRLVGPALAAALSRAMRPDGGLPQSALGVVALSLAACALASHAIGLHLVFGPLLLGVAVARTAPDAARSALVPRIELLALPLLPLFFALPGLSIDFGTIVGPRLLELAVVVVTACVGKLMTGAIAAYAAGYQRNEALTVGALLNVRGLMELVVLNIGLVAGIVSADLYAVFVAMTVLTTLMAAPLLRLAAGPRGGLQRRETWARQPLVGGLDD